MKTLEKVITLHDGLGIDVAEAVTLDGTTQNDVLLNGLEECVQHMRGFLTADDTKRSLQTLCEMQVMIDMAFCAMGLWPAKAAGVTELLNERVKDGGGAYDVPNMDDVVAALKAHQNGLSMVFEGDGDLLMTYAVNEGLEDVRRQAVGFLLDCGDQGVYEPSMGRLEGVTPERVKSHNDALSMAYIKGLDANCQIGEGAEFFWNNDKKQVQTWSGTVVADGEQIVDVRKMQNGRYDVAFRRGDKFLRGRQDEESGSIMFKRYK